jgi:hypothetical protein
VKGGDHSGRAISLGLMSKQKKISFNFGFDKVGNKYRTRAKLDYDWFSVGFQRVDIDGKSSTDFRFEVEDETGFNNLMDDISRKLDKEVRNSRRKLW